MTNYTINTGDTLSKIAKSHNTTVQELARLNNISNPNKITVGQTIKLVEEKPAQQTAQPDTNEQLQNELSSTQKQLAQLQNQMNTKNNNLSTLDMFGYGIAGIATYEIGKSALPYAWNGAQKATNATINTGKQVANTVSTTAKHAAKKAKLEYELGKDAVKQGAKKAKNAVVNTGKRVANTVSNTAKHVAKKAELEYAFGKDAIKQGAKKATNAVTNTGKRVISKSGKIMKLTKYGKVVSKRIPVVGLTVAAVETYQAGQKGGTKAAVKQGAKSASGLACGAMGAKVGAAIGACTGPAAVVATPVLAVVGGVAGYIGGEKLMDKVSSLFN